LKIYDLVSAEAEIVFNLFINSSKNEPRVLINLLSVKKSVLVACLHDQNKSGFFGGPAFIQPFRAIWNVFKKPWLAGKKLDLQKSHFCFDHV